MTRRKRRILTAIVVLGVVLLVLQLQPVFIWARRGVAGSFGLRPVTHECLGWVSTAQNVTWLPFADFQFRLGYFQFRYTFNSENLLDEAPMCIGQDIWYGE